MKKKINWTSSKFTPFALLRLQEDDKKRGKEGGISAKHIPSEKLLPRMHKELSN